MTLYLISLCYIEIICDTPNRLMPLSLASGVILAMYIKSCYISLYTDKPNPVAAPVLHQPACDSHSDECSFVFLVEWSNTDYYYTSLSLINYNVYILLNGERFLECINVHGTSCVKPLDPIVLGKYAAYVETVWDIQNSVPPDRSSELSELSNTITVSYSSIPGTAIYH